MLPLPAGAGLAALRDQGRLLSDLDPTGTFARFPIQDVVRILRDVSNGLRALHADFDAGVPFVHGEVCPQYIYIDERGTARLVPLVSRHLTPGPMPLQNGYTAPEFLLGDHGDPRADVFSVGVMLWQALAGSRLFSELSVGAAMHRLLEDRYPRKRGTTGEAATRGLCLVAEQATALDPDERFKDISELCGAMQAALCPPSPLPASENRLELAQTLVDVTAKLAKEPAKPPRPIRQPTPWASVVDVVIEPMAEKSLAADLTNLASALPPSAPHHRSEWLRAAMVAVASASVAAVVGWFTPLPGPNVSAAAATPSPSPTAAASPTESPVLHHAAPPSPPAATASCFAPTASTPEVTPSASAERRPRHRVKVGEPKVADSDYGI